MRSLFAAAALPCAGLVLFAAPQAHAHVVAGSRVFPVTLTIDDPGVSDEASIPAFTYSRSGSDGGTGPTRELDLGFEYDKTITPTTALILNWGYDIQDVHGGKTLTGFDNLYVTGKWQAYTNAEHEFVASFGVIREIGGTGTSRVGADEYGSTAPSVYLGKGFGDLPVAALRPLAITGELNYTIADRKLKLLTQSDGSTQFNNGNSNAWSGGLSVQYSLPYLQANVKDVGLRGIFANLIPVVEFTWSSAASAPNNQGTKWTAAPGLIYLTNWGEIGLEATVPLNRNAGTSVGVIGLVHVFFDDLFPHSIGKPIFQ